MNSAKRGIPMLLDKGVAAAKPIVVLGDVKRVYLPLSYGDQRRCRPVVKDFDTVMAGSVLAEPIDLDDVPLISSVTGVVAGMSEMFHPLYGQLTCSAIDAMLFESPTDPVTPTMPEDVDADTIMKCCKQAGIVDELDGVQLHLKLADWAATGTTPCLIADATEPEPFQSSAYAVLRAHSKPVQFGLRLAALAAGIPATRIALQTSYSRGRKLAERFDPNDIHSIRRRRYPLFDKEPAEYRGQCGFIGVQACLALYRAVTDGTPQTSTVITVTGDAIDEPRNLLVPFGTPIEAALQACGVDKTVGLLLLGDALSGVEITDRSLPILPGMTCLLAFSDPIKKRMRSCIGCGQCAAVCHKGLLPYEIARRYENLQYERLSALEPQECDACAACSAVCPAHRPLVQTVQQAAHSMGTIFVDWGDE
ncbi:MAG: 4Fe-4S dicluster domain-containing protein [Clostridia bacterium]|nr:4Fe-4S dicluster domain-containing protein [Clostridia bacterium]